MKQILTILIFTLTISHVSWLGNFEDAKKEAVSTHKHILINFSGSDWCGPCIMLRKQILESSTFENYASDNLILVRADFPRQKKNKLSKVQVKLNEALADKYNPDGKFPFTLLVDEHGAVLKEWDGYPNESPEKFVEQINQYAGAGK
ncbi:thioredoxin family protein [Mucilaginibacter segetis]|uniref:Thioredoxin family protein n=1 Tax=Mucilaginibacter segetis TaxID=2793071 RepID=A0A934PS84_9SPHI|nr:thioredoxin family protein [Mucilaginibacter segetis]MBK0378677.1 thioredoxin family protein [Mucilaginibacter segetis]